MYNGVLKWLQNHLISAPNCRTQSSLDLEKQHKTIKSFTSPALLIVEPQESLSRMDLEIGGKRGKTAKVIHGVDKKSKNRTNVTHETGDALKHNGAKPKIGVPVPKFVDKAPTPGTKSKMELTRKELMSEECAQRQTERIEELNRENEENDENAEVLGIPLPFRSIGERSSMTDLHKLFEQCPQPQPPLINKQLKMLQLNADQAIIMTEQVRKMKSGMERLQEVIKKFNCTEKFKQDIDFIIANVGPAIVKSERMRTEQIKRSKFCDSPEENTKIQAKP